MDSNEMKKAKRILIAVSGHFDSCLSNDCVCSKRIAAALREVRRDTLEEAAKILEKTLLGDHIKDGKLKCSKDAASVIRAAKERDNG